MKGDLTGILRFRIIGYQEMLSFLISRQLMSFALRLIKKIELKTLTDFFFFFCMTRVIYCLSSRKTCWWFVCSAWHRRVTVTSDEFTRVKMIESLHLQSAVKINEACTYSESNCDLFKWYSRVDIVHWCASWVGKWSSFSTWYVKMYELTSSEGQEQQVSVNIAEKRSSI